MDHSKSLDFQQLSHSQHFGEGLNVSNRLEKKYGNTGWHFYSSFATFFPEFLLEFDNNKEHLTSCTFAQEVGSGKLSYLTLQSDCVGSVGDVSENKKKNKI